MGRENWEDQGSGGRCGRMSQEHCDRLGRLEAAGEWRKRRVSDALTAFLGKKTETSQDRAMP